MLRTLDLEQAGFDGLKREGHHTSSAPAATPSCSSSSTSRFWNASGPWGMSNGSSYADLGYQNTWEVSRAQPGTSGILVNYTGGNTAGAFASVHTLRPRRQRSQGRRLCPRLPAPARDRVSRHLRRSGTAAPRSRRPFRDPNLLCSYSYWKVGQYTAFAGYEGVPQGSIHFAGEHCSQDFQGFMEGGASEGIRAALEVWHAVGGKG